MKLTEGQARWTKGRKPERASSPPFPSGVATEDQLEPFGMVGERRTLGLEVTLEESPTTC